MKKLFALTCIVAMIVVSCFSASIAAATNTELIINGGFEGVDTVSQLPLGWSFHSYQAEYNSNPQISYAEVVNDDTRGNVLHITSLADDDAAVYQTLQVKEGSIYKLSCYIKTSGITSNRTDGNAAGANIALRGSVAVRTDPIMGDSDWKYVELVGRTDNGQTTLTVSCRVGGYSGDSHGEAWFDDFSVIQLDSGYNGAIVNFFSSSANDPTDSADGSNAWKTLAIIAVAVIGIVLLCIGIKFVNAKSKLRNGRAGRTEGGLAREMEKKQSDIEKLQGKSFYDTTPLKIPDPTDNKLHFVKWDWILLVCLMVVYSAIALINLGTTNFPESAWKADTGAEIRIEFDGEHRITDVWQNSGISHCNYVITTDNGEEIAFTWNDDSAKCQRRTNGHMFRWAKMGGASTPTTGVTLRVNGGDMSRSEQPALWLNELAFFDENNELIKCTVDASAAALFDEQDTVPAYPSHYNGMYFDELYHARTALEHIENLPVYEWTHPPLGKLIISIGISIFGMNPFGWRIMGTLFGIGMIPIMYCFGKRFFKRPLFAFLASFLFAFDFMHFTQTRIATIDVFGVFFILLMTYYMYQFIRMDIGDDIKKTLKPLALSGLFFGLGCASKWICLYTGAALAILLFTKLAIMGVKSYRLQKKGEYPSVNFIKKYWNRFGATCLWCVLCFVMIPVMIYSASYCRYYTAQWKPQAQKTELTARYASGEYVYGVDNVTYLDVELTTKQKLDTYIDGVWANQEAMFNYHSGLTQEHRASSPWWMWLFNLRPVWYHVGSGAPGSNTTSTISAFGNPAVWLLCFIGTVALVFVLVFKRKRFPLEPFFLFICIASSLLPWVFVTRSTYAYHYFATVPFITLASVYLLKYIEDMNELSCKYDDNGKRTWIMQAIPYMKWVWIALTALLFLIFYPVISGAAVSTEYITALQWVPFKKIEKLSEDGTVIRTLRMGWTFLGYGD